jgi:hypothetical protein
MSKPLRSIRLTPKSEYDRFTGNRGEIFYDPVNNTLRIFNSTTVGGEIMATRSWVATQLPSIQGLASVSYVNQAIAAIPQDPEYLLKITADDSTVLAVDREETLQVRGQGSVTTSISTDSTGIQLIITGPEIPQLQDGTLDITAASLGFLAGVPVNKFSTDPTFVDNSPSTVPTEAAIRGYIDRRLGLTHTGEVVSQLNKIGPKYLTNSEFFVLLQTSSSSIGADEDRTIDALQFSLSAYTASFTATRTLRISNLIQGRMVTVYVRNTNGSSRTINVEASDTEEDFVSVNMSRGAGQTSVTSITLAATSGTAVITVFGANGEICGFVN